MGIRPSFKLLFLGIILTLTLLFNIYSPPSIPALQQSIFSPHRWLRPSCAPNDYAAGNWTFNPRTNRTKMTDKTDAFAFSGFEGCASSREVFWHLASDKTEQWDRFPNAQSWTWTPGERCNIAPFDKEAMVRDLVEEGGWLLLGDSITEGHFFSLSCMLYPHVRATPNYIENPYFDRAWPQHLYLNPDSPLVATLRTSSSFNISSTPLVTFRRVDLLLSKDELVHLHKTQTELQADTHSNSTPISHGNLFSEEQTWSMSVRESMDLFTSTEEGRNYRTMIVSTGGHWTTTLLSGFRDESKKDSGYGIDGVLAFFRQGMKQWADGVQGALDADSRTHWRRPRQRQVIVRAYLPGHEDCHSHREPWTTIQPFKWNWYNWGNIWEFNQIFESLLSSSKYPSIHFLPIDRPARLRPDAHSSGDCLHIMVGANVMEGWSHYIWHYINKEL
ncbi:hypothetical protein HGRIS_003041 [Hohenbuehelia grisea]|uniref:Uncharacterized protein n=1 Tax=Hohenbuehelia grisea TaxID=104357 RepID=A0ABR3JMA7_9AGAR